jgi:hypothetical protein
MPNALVPLATARLTSDTASITFSNISDAYRHLYMTLTVKSDITGSNHVQMRFNSDSNNNYSYLYMYRLASTPASGFNPNENQTTAPGRQDSSNFSAGEGWIFNYKNTDRYKTGVSSGFTNSGIVIWYCPMWRSTSAINTIYLYPSGGTVFRAGSQVVLYGLGA